MTNNSNVVEWGFAMGLGYYLTVIWNFVIALEMFALVMYVTSAF